ncbi:MAG: SGNH/GDSL hydrolase family protein [Paenibacillaceae bacterium]
MQRDTVERLRSEGDTHLHFLDGFKLLGEEDASECTVDGSHPTDLGFLRMSRSLEPIFRELLKEVL